MTGVGAPPPQAGHVTVFTGHRVDMPGRPVPRFPAGRVRAAAREIAGRVSPPAGISSAANGGDLLFLEACRSRGLAVHVVLPFDPHSFVATSVLGDPAHAWEDRFWRIWMSTPRSRRHVLGLAVSDEAYAATNRMMLSLARRIGGEPRLLALWDGRRGEGPGGTGTMVQDARARGFDITIIRPRR